MRRNYSISDKLIDENIKNEKIRLDFEECRSVTYRACT